MIHFDFDFQCLGSNFISNYYTMKDSRSTPRCVRLSFSRALSLSLSNPQTIDNGTTTPKQINPRSTLPKVLATRPTTFPVVPSSGPPSSSTSPMPM